MRVVALLTLALTTASASNAQSLQAINPPDGWSDAIVTNVSDDGRVLVGVLRNYTGDFPTQAFDGRTAH